MPVQRLAIQQLRNLMAVDIHLSPDINLFYGENGSGKTSILEALHLLGLGRSFRSHKHKSLINQQSSDFTLFSQLTVKEEQIPLGISRNLAGDLQIRARGEKLNSVADLAGYLPLQLINADSFLLLEGGPTERRQFLDWLVFHVEPTFFPLWKRLQTCLKHRNSLLRHDRMDARELAVWDRELVQLTEQIDGFRESAFQQFAIAFQSLIQEFVQLDELSISYYPGWNRDKAYAEVLVSSFDRDLAFGQTHYGSHRADLRLMINGMAAADLLSRGQQKLLVCAMKLAQGLVFQQLTGRKAIYLVDDLPAELDVNHRQRLAFWLDKLGTQVFITGVEERDLRCLWQDQSQKQIKVFHVEQGKVVETAALSQQI